MEVDYCWAADFRAPPGLLERSEPPAEFRLMAVLARAAWFRIVPASVRHQAFPKNSRLAEIFRLARFRLLRDWRRAWFQ